MSDHTSKSSLVQLSLDDAEHWKEIPGYEGLYAVSDRGRVMSLRRRHVKQNRVLAFRTARNGYPYVILAKDGKIINARVHRLVMLAFKGQCADGQTVNHIDGDKTNNQLDNLEYLSQRDNNLHSFRVLGRQVPKGENKPHAKLTEADVHEIKRLLQEAHLTNKEIGQQFGVGATVISNIKTGHKWKHVK